MLENRERWLYTFLAQLLAAEPGALGLLDASASDVFTGGAPRFAKVDMYHYEMAAPLSAIVAELWRGGDPAWWRRTWKEVLVPPVELGPSGDLSRASIMPG